MTHDGCGMRLVVHQGPVVPMVPMVPMVPIVPMVEENLVVIIFHCTLKNIKKLIESSLYPKRSTVKGQILFHIVR